jgi:hypothetical protein
MTVPSLITCAPWDRNMQGERPIFQEVRHGHDNGAHAQGIFCPIAPEEDQSKLEPILHTSRCPPPLYRNMSLLSSPSRDSSFDSNKEDYEQIPADFIPPRHIFSLLNRVTSDNASQSSKISSKNVVQLQPEDIVCGRGAQGSFHPGNRALRDLVKKHETTYLSSKRSEKPRIAMELMGILRSRGVRFVKREKMGGRSIWIEIGDQSVYGKICQSLREGAPELRRWMLASDARKVIHEQMELRDKESYSPIPCFYFVP